MKEYKATTERLMNPLEGRKFTSWHLNETMTPDHPTNLKIENGNVCFCREENDFSQAEKDGFEANIDTLNTTALPVEPEE